ncbi:unconventional myosin-Va-like [Zophobas morio]|uniref:unconventional myosin-Va-like n=1 Tax=Zophobas morio TaxID=2755281 RepID=UPI0030837F35
MAAAVELYKPGVQVWVEDDEEAWLQGTIINVEPDSYKVLTPKKGEQTFASPPPLCNEPDQWQLNDMTNLNFLHEPALLQTLQVRFQQDLIYTYSGIVLVSVNPFKSLPYLYDASTLELYRGQQLGQLDPHLFAVAEESYQCLCRTLQSQSIIISGESGAGKTVSAKFVMRYLAISCGTDVKQSSGNVEDQILASNPILEAFGNSKTTRNDNSSRFGKFMQLQLSEKKVISGAVIRTYLLEKSRIVTHASQERNYHIFYQLLEGLDSNKKEAWKLTNCGDYRYTNQGVAHVPDVDDNKDFLSVCSAMRTLGMKDDTIESIWKIISGILHMGNIIGADRGISNQDSALLASSKLLDIDDKLLLTWINKRKIVAGKDVMLKPNTKNEQYDAIDALAKAVYSRNFDYLVEIINSATAKEEHLFIGILDIYGFESFDKNSFEQFCINYANENLQQQFNSHVFKKEQEDYVKEGINWSFIGFTDNKPCLELIESRAGIIALLDEECIMTKGSDENFCDKLYNNFKEHEFFSKPKLSGKRALFTISHFAQKVTYDAAGFLEKNKDKIADELLDVVRQSKMPYLQGLFPSVQKPPEEEAKRAPKKPLTVGSKFKASLRLLMDTIYTTNTHYVRCLKPNMAKLPGLFSRSHMLEQLRACGVLSTIKISQAGFPGKVEYNKFFERFRPLTWTSGDDVVQRSKEIVKEYVKEGNYQFGKTKVFFRAGELGLLEAKRNDVLNSAIINMQAFIRGSVQKTYYHVAVHSVVLIETMSRLFMARKTLRSLRESYSALLIETTFRSFLYCKFFKQSVTAIFIQKLFRAFEIYKQYKSLQVAHYSAVLIQSCYKYFSTQKTYRRTLDIIVYSQSCVRRKATAKQYRILLAESRDLRNQHKEITEKASKLELKVVELLQENEMIKKLYNEKERELLVKISALDMNLNVERKKNSELLEKIDQLTRDSNSYAQRVTKLQNELVSVQNAMKSSQQLETRASEKHLATELYAEKKLLDEYVDVETHETLQRLTLLQSLNIELEKENELLRKEVSELKRSPSRTPSNELLQKDQQIQLLTSKNAQLLNELNELSEKFLAFSQSNTLKSSSQTSISSKRSHRRFSDANSISCLASSIDDLVDLKDSQECFELQETLSKNSDVPNGIQMFQYNSYELPELFHSLSSCNSDNCSGKPAVAFVISRCLRYTVYFNLTEDRNIICQSFINMVKK